MGVLIAHVTLLTEAHGLDSYPASGKSVEGSAHQQRPGWASLVVKWLRIHLPMQGTRVQALVWEDPTCRGATKPLSHNY